MTEGFKAYLIPDSKREDYFEFIEKLYDAEGSKVENVLDAYSDPIVKFSDISIFTEKNQKALKSNMARIGAKDISENYINN